MVEDTGWEGSSGPGPWAPSQAQRETDPIDTMAESGCRPPPPHALQSQLTAEDGVFLAGKKAM